MSAGDVYRYTPEDRHCREGLAIEDDRGQLIDNFWSGDRDPFLMHIVPRDARDLEFKGNLGDYDKLHPFDDISDYAREDRLVVTAQHGHRRTYYVRKGAQPDLATKIENAQSAVEVAERKLDSARRQLDWKRSELATLKAQQVTA